MLQTDTFVIDPVETPGFIHANKLTKESAKTTEDLLKENNEKYHIFFTLEDHMGVRIHGLPICGDQGSGDRFETSVLTLQIGVPAQPHRPS